MIGVHLHVPVTEAIAALTEEDEEILPGELGLTEAVVRTTVRQVQVKDHPEICRCSLVHEMEGTTTIEVLRGTTIREV